MAVTLSTPRLIVNVSVDYLAEGHRSGETAEAGADDHGVGRGVDGHRAQ
jgi:hypothetical protein